MSSLFRGSPFPVEFLSTRAQISGPARQASAMRFVMTDLIYIGGGVAVLLIYALYAVALRKV